MLCKEGGGSPSRARGARCVTDEMEDRAPEYKALFVTSVNRRVSNFDSDFQTRYLRAEEASRHHSLTLFISFLRCRGLHLSRPSLSRFVALLKAT